MWYEGGRGYKLEMDNNKAGRFLFTTVLSIEEKRFSLVFPEGKVLFGGWKILAIKLRSIKVLPVPTWEVSKELVQRVEDKGDDTILENGSFVEGLIKGKGEVGEAVWIESKIEVLCNLVPLKKSLVGKWDVSSDRVPVLDLLKLWALRSWELKGDLHLSLL